MFTSIRNIRNIWRFPRSNNWFPKWLVQKLIYFQHENSINFDPDTKQKQVLHHFPSNETGNFLKTLLLRFHMLRKLRYTIKGRNFFEYTCMCANNIEAYPPNSNELNSSQWNELWGKCHTLSCSLCSLNLETYEAHRKTRKHLCQLIFRLFFYNARFSLFNRRLLYNVLYKYTANIFF